MPFTRSGKPLALLFAVALGIPAVAQADGSATAESDIFLTLDDAASGAGPVVTIDTGGTDDDAADTEVASLDPQYIDAGSYACANLDKQVDAFRTAMINADSETLLSLAHENLSFGHSNGLIQTREEFVESVATHTEIFNSIDLTDRHSECDGRIGIERHLFSADILLKGEPLNVTLSVLEVWHNNGIEWKLVARQAFSI